MKEQISKILFITLGQQLDQLCVWARVLQYSDLICFLLYSFAVWQIFSGFFFLIDYKVCFFAISKMSYSKEHGWCPVSGSRTLKKS